MPAVPRVPSACTLKACAGAVWVVLGVACSGSVEHTGASPRPLPGPAVTAPPRVAVNKVDILFDIDNSGSMGDKQGYLAEAIPDLLGRLMDPNCVDARGVVAGPSTNGTCPAGYAIEFPPVRDLHLGIVSSSLGPRGGDACSASAFAVVPFNNVSAHNDDQAHLLNRTLTYEPDGGSVTEGVVADAQPEPFLYWFPTGGPNAGKTPGVGQPVTDASTLIGDFTQMVGGTGVFGCGIESQLESWYRFLIQPDPYAAIAIKGSLGNAQGEWEGVDTTILQERHDFLRPDSLVLIVDLSDENDSEIDVRSLGGQGVNWMSGAFNPPGGTSACNTNPGSSACHSCVQGNNGDIDSQCMSKPTYTAINDWGYDLNLRHVHMKAKYGVDPQFPIERYVTGLTSTSVPDRCGEYGGANCAAPFATAQGSYQGTPDCQNPLFAAQLPDGSKTDVDTLCHAPPGTRTPDLVFYAHIGGVPNQLLHFTPGNPAASALTAADWVKILGNDPENYDYSGIDPHMIESYQPRAGLAPPGSQTGADPVSGHEWITNTSNGMPGFDTGSQGAGHLLAVDLEYACIFPLADRQGNPTPRDCSQVENDSACACPHVAGGLTAEEIPPVCDPTTQTMQFAAKSYPTVRELLLARKMGNQGMVSSICPIHVADNAAGDDPLYGYRPAVTGIVDHLKTVLSYRGGGAG
jgi:hypothetical protein